MEKYSIDYKNIKIKYNKYNKPFIDYIYFNISQTIIGILLGFVTSIPELITFFESQRHHSKSKNDILGVVEATNNLLTSNILNLFVIQSIGIIIFTIFYG